MRNIDLEDYINEIAEGVRLGISEAEIEKIHEEIDSLVNEEIEKDELVDLCLKDRKFFSKDLL